jgi:branched-chain amino acid transport system permease protein
MNLLEWTDTLLQGVLLGGLYALFAMGLSITYGVMRLVNIAHGDFILLASYLALAAAQSLGAHPFVVLPLVVAVMAALGYTLQRALLNRTLGPDLLPPLLVCFGMAVLIRNGLLVAFSADSMSLDIGALATASLPLGQGLAVGVFPLLVFGLALGLLGGIHLLLGRTALGMQLRATADDPATAALMGLDTRHVYALALALAFALVGVAGVCAGARTSFTPETGPAALLYAFEAVVIGGLGSLGGTFAGAVVLGVAQAVGAKIDAGLGILAGHLVFLAVLAFKPDGLFPKTRG